MYATTLDTPPRLAALAVTVGGGIGLLQWVAAAGTGWSPPSMPRYAGTSPPVWAKSLLTTFQVPSMRTSWK
ncbi:hypothetical protein SAMN05660209_00275 [Geodermatophilus africanus]|uniref:Uncharacterized protein n=1 Tax=Geodermatophilus africanus TaxID=1137993 RepID=A0A1H3B3L4_9ACTN|nr:hypothetical protein SAMN05660209_00275 [Geodermatophilus africanus]